MRNKKVRFILVFVFISLILSLSSCKKNNGGNSFISSLLSSKNSDVDPLVIVPDPNSNNESAPHDVATLEHEYSNSSEVSSDSSEPIISDEDNAETESEEVAVALVPAIPSAVSFTQSLYTIDDEVDNALLSDDVPLIETGFSYKGINAEFYVFSTFSRIILPDDTTDDDIALWVSLLCTSYPEETKYITYQRVGDCLVLTYPRCDKDYLGNILNSLFEKGRLYIDRFMSSEVEDESDEETSYSVSFTLYGDIEAILRLTQTTLVVTTNRSLTSEELDSLADAILSALPEHSSLNPEISEKGVSFTFDKLDSAALSNLYSRVITLLNTYASNVDDMNKVNETIEEEKSIVVTITPSDVDTIPVVDTVPVVVPVTEKGKKVLNFEVGLNGSVYYDYVHNQLRNTADGRFSYHITDKFSLGVKAGYDWGNYVIAMGYMKYNITKKIYLFAGAGYKFDLDANTQYSSFIVEAGIGFEHNIASSFFVFGEISAKYAPFSYSKLTPSLSLGFNYKF